MREPRLDDPISAAPVGCNADVMPDDHSHRRLVHRNDANSAFSTKILKGHSEAMSRRRTSNRYFNNDVELHDVVLWAVGKVIDVVGSKAFANERRESSDIHVREAGALKAATLRL
jgi:hypothetical protein